MTNQRLAEMREVHQEWHLKVSPGLLRSKCYLCKLLAYAEAVGELHKPADSTNVNGHTVICWHCSGGEGGNGWRGKVAYPCPTAKLSELLEGKVGE